MTVKPKTDPNLVPSPSFSDISVVHECGMLDEEEIDSYHRNQQRGVTHMILDFIHSQINTLRSTNFRVYRIRKCAKIVRKTLGFSKSPKKKGYGTLLTDEEKR